MASPNHRRTAAGIRLEQITRALEAIAPLELAEEWDNVGMILGGGSRRVVRRILLAIDLTDAVVAEAVARKVDLVVGYHPPMFQPLRRLAGHDPQARLIRRCIQHDLLVYSPHTALDAAAGGINDWLAGAFLPCTIEPLIERSKAASVPLVPDGIQSWRDAFSSTRPCSPRAGKGRLAILDRSLRLSGVVTAIKRHLGIRHLRVAHAARARNPLISRIAVGAGAGGEILRDALMHASPFDLFVTGELRHHETLHACANGVGVVLVEHSNSERGFLPVLAHGLRRRLGSGIDILVSRTDREPLLSC